MKSTDCLTLEDLKEAYKIFLKPQEGIPTVLPIGLYEDIKEYLGITDEQMFEREYMKPSLIPLDETACDWLEVMG